MPTVKRNVVNESGKRKTAIARVTIVAGKGRVRINKVPVEILTPESARTKIMEPLLLSTDLSKDLDIDVDIRGGGYMSRAEAARIAIARALLKWTKSTSLRDAFLNYDRGMISGDPRKKEAKKFGGPGARVRKQKSYR